MKHAITAHDYHSGIFAGLNPSTLPQESFNTVFQWLKIAAEVGDANAQANLGVMYAKGINTPEDPIEATRWFHLAANQGHGMALYNLGIASEDRRVNHLHGQHCRNYYARAVNTGYAWAALRLAQLDIDGVRPEAMKDAYGAFKSLSREDALFDIDVRRAALFWRSACQLFGRGVRKLRPKGLEGMLQSARLGYRPALHFLYDYHLQHGPGFPTDQGWGMGHVFRLYPQQTDKQSAYILWSLVPDKHRPGDQYRAQNIGQYERELAEHELHFFREAFKQTNAMIRERRIAAMAWANESGILALHAEPAEISPP